MKTPNTIVTFLVLVCAAVLPVRAQTTPPPTSFSAASATVQRQLDESLAELAKLRAAIAEDTIPLSRKLSELETELLALRQSYQQTSRVLDGRTLDLNNLRTEIKSRQDEGAYLANLLGEYVRNFESRLHIAEVQRHHDVLAAAKLAAENTGLTQQEVFQAQTRLLEASLNRLHDLAGGTRFEGTAVDSGGTVRRGKFVLLGPVALFQSADGADIGTAEQRLGSLEPAVLRFENPADAQTAAQVVAGNGAIFPLDPTLGGAHVIEGTKETLAEHIAAGGPVMVPIFALAGAALLVAVYKWIALVFVGKPSRKRLTHLLQAVAQRDKAAAVREASAMRGPAGKMLVAGAHHLGEPRELIEEVMYEKALATRLKLQRWLPFIAISASAAPLLGLLGTVTGIMNTFKLITVYGTGDVKTLSSGISEALITTEYGLMVAIPALLLHAFLTRKAKGVMDQMDKAAIAFVNEVSKSAAGNGK